MAAEMAGAGVLLSAPPPPTFRAPTRESVLVTRRRSSTIDEQDLSFMDSEIKRLHRDMANMLAGEIPLGDDNHMSRSKSAPSPTMPLPTDQGGSVEGTSGAGVVISRRTSPAGDSDFDYSDDDDGIAILKDDLRTTTERFFDRLPRQTGPEEQGDADGKARRRASARILTGYGGSGSVKSGGGLRRQYSWKSLEQLEKGVGGMMRRHTGSASTALQSLDGGGSCSSAGSGGLGSGAGADGNLCAPVFVGSDRFVGVGLERSTAATRRLKTSSTGGRSPNDNRSNFSPSSGGETPRRRPPRDSNASVNDLKARSEEAARTLEALKMLLAKEGPQGAEEGGVEDPRHRERRSGSKLWPSSGGERTAEAFPSSVRARGGGSEGVGGGSRSSGGSSSSSSSSNSSESSKRMELLAQAMKTLEQINAQLDSEATDPPSKRTTNGREYRHHRHRRSRSSLGTSERRQPPGRQSFGLPTGSASQQLNRQPRSSSDLLRHRRSEEGQAEPMSCGVPRHRVQVSKGGDNNIVYFELAITQARSTWTLERRMSEFVELRKSLVATAAVIVAARREREAATVKLLSDGPGARVTGGSGRSLQDARRQHGREAEARVPPLPEERKSWFDSTGIWSVMYARKREENLTERQVQLASWLAKVLADRELVSPELVRFLGGDSGGVQALPVVEDVVSADSGGGDDESFLGAEGACSWSCSSDDNEEDDGDDYDDDDDDDDLKSDELDSLRGSLCAPDEWDLAKSGSKSDMDFTGSRSPRRRGDSSGGSSRSFSPHRRLEKAMGKRLAARARREIVGEGEIAGWGADEVPGIPNSSGTSGELLSGGDTAVEDEEEDEEEEVHSPGLENAYLASVDASRQPRAPSPSPSSPTRRVMLDAFFQPPT